MAWTTPLTAVANAALTAAQWNASVRDNLNETAPAKASASGQIFASTGANTIVARTPNTASIATTESTTSTSFADLTTPGPSLLGQTTGTKVLVMVHTRMANQTAGGITRCGWAVSGAGSVAASDELAIAFESSAANDNIWCSGAWVYTGFSAGSNAIAMKYKVDAGTGVFSDRRLSIVPF